MNTKLLKQKILDLAIRGKLTQQLEGDGAAADLLKQISEQKRESSSTLSSPRRRGSPSAQSEKTIIPLDKKEAPFEIPANWEWVRLGDLCSKFSTGPFGTMLHKEDYVLEGGVPLVNPTNLQDGVIESDKIKLVKLEKYESLRPYILETNDIVLARRGDLSKCAVVSENENLWLAGTGAFFLKLILVDVRFFTRLYRTSFVQSYLVADSIGSTMDNLNQTTLGNLPVPLPPLAEQRRIVEKIQEAFAEIDSIENNKELLKTHIKQARQKILDLAIHGKLVPQNKTDEPACVLLERITRDNPHYEKIEDEPFEIPENWVWCTLGNLSESIQYGYNAPAKDSGRIKMVRISDIHENEVEWDSVPYCDIDEKEIQTYLLKKNDILFARTGGTVGKSFIVSNLPEDAVYAGYLIRTRYGKKANAQYMKYFMESNLYWEQLRDGCIATAQPNCNGKTLGKMKIPLPPLNEQSRIVAKIEELFSTLDQMERNLV